jgi:V8-like Glu-specific endopeptidase
MFQQRSSKLLIVALLFVGTTNHFTFGSPQGFKFPDGSSSVTSDATASESEASASKVIDEILSASRSGRDLKLSVGGKEVDPLASDSTLRELSAQPEKQPEARSYVATKLCSLGLANCGEERHGGSGSYGPYGGLTNIRDVTLVQPVAIKPIGEPIAAIPLDNNRPFGSSSSGGSFGSGFENYPLENKNYPSFQNRQGGFVNPQDCTCVPVSQCKSYDIVNPQPSGSSGIGAIDGYGRPHHGNVGAGIDPRNLKSDSNIESNATIVESDAPVARNARSNVPTEEKLLEKSELSNSTKVEQSSDSTRRRREAPIIRTDGRVLNGGSQRGCYDSRYVCCRNPIQDTPYNPNPSGGSSFYPSTSSYYPSSYPRPETDQSYRPPVGGYGNCGRRNTNGINGRVLAGGQSYGGIRPNGRTEFGEYPWQVAILKKEGGNSVFVCGGSIIDNRHILTAAHCIKTNRPEDLKIRLGEWDVNSENEFYPHIELDVAAISIHPEYYAGNLINDIAIVKLNGFVDFSKYPHIAPICLPERNADFIGKRCYATGWGKDAFGQAGKFQKILSEVDVPVVPHYECEQRLKRTRLGPDFSLHQGFMCAGGEPEKDACKGKLPSK